MHYFVNCNYRLFSNFPIDTSGKNHPNDRFLHLNSTRFVERQSETTFDRMISVCDLLLIVLYLVRVMSSVHIINRLSITTSSRKNKNFCSTSVTPTELMSTCFCSNKNCAKRSPLPRHRKTE